MPFVYVCICHSKRGIDPMNLDSRATRSTYRILLVLSVSHPKIIDICCCAPLIYVALFTVDASALRPFNSRSTAVTDLN